MQDNRFEVVCRRCEVTFPPGTRRCMHCGGRTESPPDPSARTPAVTEISYSPHPTAPVEMPAPDPTITVEPQPHEWEEEQDEAPARQSHARRTKSATFIWLVLALIGILARACDT